MGKRGRKSILDVNKKEYPAVKFDKEEGQLFRVYKNRTSTSKISILEIVAKNGDYVYMAKRPMHYPQICWRGTNPGPIPKLKGSPERAPSDQFDILRNIEEFKAELSDENLVNYDEAVFPMVDIDQEVDVKWLENIKACSENEEKYAVVQALQQTKFQMNEKGAKVESAAAISMVYTECAPKPKKVFTITDSFYLWIMRPGMKTPIFAAYIDFDAWKAPKIADAKVDVNVVEKALEAGDKSAKELLEKMSDEEVVAWSKIADMDGYSVFRDNLRYPEYRERIIKLSDDAFIDLMANCKIWHGGTPMMHITSRHDETIMRQFWNRIKQLPTHAKILEALNADYFGETFVDFIKRRKDLQATIPSDIFEEIKRNLNFKLRAFRQLTQ
jgi:hypothetical protein